jgi:hypothetical protein
MLSLQKIHSNKKYSILIILAIIVLVSAGIFYYVNQKNNNTPITPPAPSGGSAATKEKDASSSTSIGSSKDQNTDSTTPEIDSGVTPQTPVGTFVSNHHPNLDGQPAPNTIESTCTTTAGATCTLTFTNEATSLSLPAQKTDQNGNTTWTWKLQDIGLTAGSWTVTATAQNGTKSAFSTDPMKLEVAP